MRSEPSRTDSPSPQESPDPGAEWVDLIDEGDRIVGKAQRREVRGKNLLHRGVGIVCCNSRGEIYVHRRTRTKDIFPGLYDMFVGGVVGAGEGYLEAARREIREELGIDGPEPQHLFDHLYLGSHNRAWVAVYDVVWDGPIRRQASEVDWGAFLTLDHLLEKIGEWEFVPDGLEIFWRLYTEGWRQSRLGSVPSESKGGGGALPPRNRKDRQ